MTKGVVGFICFGGGIRSYIFVGEGVNNAYIVMCMYEVLGSKWTVELRIRKNLGESDLYNGMTTQLVNNFFFFFEKKISTCTLTLVHYTSILYWGFSYKAGRR